ncbi:MAG: hypothetical protein J6Y02_14645 [Pseudobutyrivibrio sp.]|nr:hypothetical protein [Pseudobutyrivibrio sp.]
MGYMIKMTVSTLLKLLTAFKPETPVVLNCVQEYPDGKRDYWRAQAINVELDKDDDEEDSEVVKISMDPEPDFTKRYTVAQLIDDLNLGITNKVWNREHFVILARQSACWYLQNVNTNLVHIRPKEDVRRHTPAEVVAVVELNNFINE